MIAMAVNKVIYGGSTLIDLSGDTVTADKLLAGYTAHCADGTAITGTLEPVTDTSDATATAEDITNGKTAYVNGEQITGTHVCEIGSADGLHIWEKYSTSTGIVEVEESDVDLSFRVSNNYINNAWDDVDYSDEIEIVDGSLSLVNPSTVTISSQATAETVIGKYVKLYVSSPLSYYRIPASATVSHTGSVSNGEHYKASQGFELSVGSLKGTFIENVCSSDSTIYPTDGEQNGYWYVYKGLLSDLIVDGGGGSVTLQEKTVTPSESQQTVTPDSGYDGLSKVTVDAVSNTYVGSAVERKSAVTYTPGTSNQVISANQYLSGAQTIKGDANLISSNIKSGISIFGVSGSYNVSGSETTNNCEAHRITSSSDTLSFSTTEGTIKVWGYGSVKETYATTVYAFVGDGYYKGSSDGSPSKTSATFGLNSDGTLSGLPSGLTSMDLLVTIGV